MARLLMALCALTLLVNTAPAKAQCGALVCAHAGAEQVMIGTQQQAMIDALLSSLAGADVDLSASELEALATAMPRLQELLDAFRASTGAASTAEALLAPLTLEAAIATLRDAALAASLPSVASALTTLASQLSALPAAAQIRLGDVLSVDATANLGGEALPLLDLITALLAAYNDQYATSVSQVPISGSALGLAPSIQSVEIGVVSHGRPSAVCGGLGATLRAAGQRIRVRLELNDVNIALLPGGLASASAALEQLELVVDVAPGFGIMDSVDALLGTVTTGATPGFAAVFLGHVADAVLLDRAGSIDFGTELAPAALGTLQVSLLGGLGSAQAELLARSHGTGPTASEASLAFSGPYPETKTAITAPDVTQTIGVRLLANLSLTLGELSPALGLSSAALNSLLAQIQAALQGPSSALAPLLATALDGLLRPALDTLDSGLGELDVTLRAPAFVPAGTDCNDGLFCTIDDHCDGTGRCVGGASPCLGDTGSCTAQTCVELQDRCEAELVAGCLVGASCFGAGARNPGDACEACIPAQSVDSFRPDLAGCDSDGDGVMDAYEQTAAGADLDTDADQTADRFDADDDGDSLPTASEAPDANRDGDPSDARDSDGDGLPDYLDSDDDDDALTSAIEKRDSDALGDGDLDGDGQTAWLDDDSDGDGAPDRQEGRADADGDGVPDYLDADVPAADPDPDPDAGMPAAQDADVPAQPASEDAGDGRADAGTSQGQAEPTVKFQLEGGAGCSLRAPTAAPASWCWLGSLTLLARARRRRGLARC